MTANLIGADLWLLKWWDEYRKLPPPAPPPREYDHPDDVLAEMQRATLVDVVTGRLGRLTVPRFDERALRRNVLRVMLTPPAAGRNEEP